MARTCRSLLSVTWIGLVTANTYCSSALCLEVKPKSSHTKLLSDMTFSSDRMAKNTEQTLNPIISNLKQLSKCHYQPTYLTSLKLKCQRWFCTTERLTQVKIILKFRCLAGKGDGWESSTQTWCVETFVGEMSRSREEKIKERTSGQTSLIVTFCRSVKGKWKKRER